MHRGPPGKLIEAAKAAHAKPPEIAEGFTAEDYETDPVEVWPENWPAWQFYCLVSTQWVIAGMGGRVSLNYPACFSVMDEMGVPAEERKQLFLDLRVIEGAVLEQQAEDNKTPPT